MFGCLCCRLGGPLPFRGSSPPRWLRRGVLRFASAAARDKGERISPASVLGVSTPCALCFLWFRLCALAAGPCPPKVGFVSSSLRSALAARFACIQFSQIVARRVSFPRFARGNAASFRFGSFLSARAARLPPEPPTKTAKGGGPRPTAESLQALREVAVCVQVRCGCRLLCSQAVGTLALGPLPVSVVVGGFSVVPFGDHAPKGQLLALPLYSVPSRNGAPHDYRGPKAGRQAGKGAQRAKPIFPKVT